MAGHVRLAQPAGQFEPVHIGQPDINDGSVETLGPEHLLGPLPAAHPVHRVALAGEPQLDAAGHHHIVFHEQKSHRLIPLQHLEA